MDRPAIDPLPAALRDWLASQREQLNGKFRLAQRRYPTLSAEVALGLCGELLPDTARAVGDAPELFGVLFDLLLLHAGRGLLAPSTPGRGDRAGGRSPALTVLFRDTFPRLGRLLAQRPRHLPGALSNAVENLGALGLDFARRLADLADRVNDPDVLLDVGVVLSWRLGDARLRTPALDRAERLPPELLADLLGVRNWPAPLVPLVLRGLRQEGWLRPEQVFSEKTRAKPDVKKVSARLDEWDESVGGDWLLASRLGNFQGFEGNFAEPPTLLEPGDGARHRFWVRSGGQVYRLDGDAFGGICRTDPGSVYPKAQATSSGTVPLPANVTSVVVRSGLVAYTLTDSFRVRILIRRRGL
jgi:hypothetical protein